MVKIVGIAGSLRRASHNRRLLDVATGLMPPGTRLQVASIDGVPLFNQDDEDAHGAPAAVIALKQAIASADGVLLVTPEYNNGIPGVFKNAIDWASRPSPGLERVFSGKPVALMGASPGGFGTVLSQAHWLPVLRGLEAQLWSGNRFMLSRAGTAFNSRGTLEDPAMSESLRGYLAGFVAFVAAQKKA